MGRLELADFDQRTHWQVLDPRKTPIDEDPHSGCDLLGSRTFHGLYRIQFSVWTVQIQAKEMEPGCFEVFVLNMTVQGGWTFGSHSWGVGLATEASGRHRPKSHRHVSSRGSWASGAVIDFFPCLTFLSAQYIEVVRD